MQSNEAAAEASLDPRAGLMHKVPHVFQGMAFQPPKVGHPAAHFWS